MIGVYAFLFVGWDFRKLAFHVYGWAGVKNLDIVAPFDESEIALLVALAVIRNAYFRQICLWEQVVAFKGAF